MDDLISRQAAIDAVNVGCEEWRGIFERCKEKLLALPSEQEEPRWIPVGEWLPKQDDRVLVYTVSQEYHVWDAMPNRGESYAWEDDSGLFHDLYEVDMWLSLPEPYAERRKQ